MEELTRMFQAHPSGQHGRDNVELIHELVMCEAACVICADACLSEQDVTMLAACIAANYDCADACAATSRMLGRVAHMQPSILRSQLEACREACRVCAEECEKHEHEHCRICAEMCRRCEQACSRALDTMMVTA